MNRPVVTVVGSFAVGMTMSTQRMPIFGETLVGSQFDMGPGGKGIQPGSRCCATRSRSTLCRNDRVRPSRKNCPKPVRERRC